VDKKIQKFYENFLYFSDGNVTWNVTETSNQWSPETYQQPVCLRVHKLRLGEFRIYLSWQMIDGRVNVEFYNKEFEIIAFIKWFGLK
jgi:hypothetical protein